MVKNQSNQLIINPLTASITHTSPILIPLHVCCHVLIEYPMWTGTGEYNRPGSHEV